MALASRQQHSTQASVGTRTHTLRSAVARRPQTGCPKQQRRVAASGETDNTTSSNKYAILRLGGVQQMLQEGLLYTCPKLVLEQHHQQVNDTNTVASALAAASSPAAAEPPALDQQQQQHQQSFLLSNVLGLHNGVQFTWGSPYLHNTTVEVEVVEEFPGPEPQGPLAAKTAAAAAAAGAGAGSGGGAAAAAARVDVSTMAIYRVKHIRAAQ